MELPAGTAHAEAFDRERCHIFLEKADIALPDERLAGLREASDAALGIDAAFLRDAMSAFAIAPSARISRSAVQGTFHRLYDLAEPSRDARLLRVAALAGSTSSALMALESGVMAMLREHGLPLPACEFRALGKAGESRGIHLVARGEGEALASFDDDEARTTTALAGVAQFLARLHRIGGTGFGPVSLRHLEGAPAAGGLRGVHARWDDYLFTRLDEHLALCTARGAITAREASDITSLFAARRAGLRYTAPVLLHGDPGSHNFLADASGIRAVIDWEDALLGDPLFDLASLCTFHPERRHAAILAAYGARLAPGDVAWATFWLYFLRIALAKTVHRFRFAYADRPGRPPASQRIQLALAKLATGA